MNLIIAFVGLTKTDKRVEGIYIEVCRKTKRGKEDINIDKLMISYMIHSKHIPSTLLSVLVNRINVMIK